MPLIISLQSGQSKHQQYSPILVTFSRSKHSFKSKGENSIVPYTYIQNQSFNTKVTGPSIRSTHILHMKIFADFLEKLHAQELGHKLGVMNFPTVTSEYNNNNLPSHRWGLAWTFCHWSSLDSQQQDSFNQRSHTSHNCMMMWFYILQNDRSNNNQLSWSLKVWYTTSICRK